eukprot:GHRR01022623.1.p1 GENE.GHRR01022623.1~~GHRR01022623.1.p1  ORF type:complete len:128 (-),score=31.27 GHRR01022623.1:11-394(-)
MEPHEQVPPEQLRSRTAFVCADELRTPLCRVHCQALNLTGLIRLLPHAICCCTPIAHSLCYTRVALRNWFVTMQVLWLSVAPAVLAQSPVEHKASTHKRMKLSDSSNSSWQQLNSPRQHAQLLQHML